MFFIISKVFSFAIDPLVWIVALALLALFSKSTIRKIRLFTIGAFAMVFFTNPFIIEQLLRWYEIPERPLNPSEQYDVGIVLGTNSVYDKKIDRLQFTGSADRFFQAIALYKTGKLKRIVYCGGSGDPLHPEETEGPWIRRYMQEVGIPDSAILIDNASRNTRENSQFALELLKNTSSTNAPCLLITSAYHMRRSLKTFEKVGLIVVPYSTDRCSSPFRWEPRLLYPDGSALHGWYILNHEWIGYIMYRLVGYN